MENMLKRIIEEERYVLKIAEDEEEIVFQFIHYATFEQNLMRGPFEHHIHVPRETM